MRFAARRGKGSGKFVGLIKGWSVKDLTFTHEMLQAHATSLIISTAIIDNVKGKLSWGEKGIGVETEVGGWSDGGRRGGGGRMNWGQETRKE